MKKYFFVLPAVLLLVAGCSANVNNPGNVGSSGVTPADTNIAFNSTTAPAGASASDEGSPADTGTSTSTANSAGVNDEATEPASVKQQLSDQPYAANSYLISGPTLSADAQKALTGFSMTKKTLADGTTQINLKALEAGYTNQQYILKPGEQLYFIEKFLADDQENQEKNLHDDQAVIVDAQGNVVQGPASFQQ